MYHKIKEFIQSKKTTREKPLHSKKENNLVSIRKIILNYTKQENNKRNLYI